MSPNELAGEIDETNVDCWRIEELANMAIECSEGHAQQVALEIIYKLAGEANEKFGQLASKVRQLGQPPVEKPAPVTVANRIVRRRKKSK